MTDQPKDLALGWNLSEKHLQAIGEVAVRWSAMEFTLSSTIWDLAELSQAHGWAITTHLSERVRVDICNSLAFDLLGEDPLAAELRQHLNFILNQVYPKRNKFLHARWGSSIHWHHKSELQDVRARGKVIIGSEKFTSDDIFSVAAEIYEANEKLADMRDRIRVWLSTSRKESTAQGSPREPEAGP